MIRLIEALNYRCLRYICQPLGPFHVLVGPNASGKTTFLDVISFISRMVSDSLDVAIEDRTSNFYDLVWKHENTFFEFAIEADIPEEKKTLLKNKFDLLRYEIRIGKDEDTSEIGILEERAVLLKKNPVPSKVRSLFPMEPDIPQTIFANIKQSGQTIRFQTILSKNKQGNDNFYSEVREEGGGKGWIPSFRLGRRKSALANLMEDETKFPVSTWFKSLLLEGVQKLVLNSLLIRNPSPPGQIRGFKTDGSNIPWVVEDLKKKAPSRFKEWISHVQTALPDIVDIETIERPEDRHRYLVVCYHDNLRIPSWMTSDGTLRLLALTLPAYLKDIQGLYLIEEPENGIHPGAVETVFQSLSSVYDAQILLATHSPVILSHAKSEQILCFKKTTFGETDIVSGNKHPQLKSWKGSPNLSVLFASGILG